MQHSISIKWDRSLKHYVLSLDEISVNEKSERTWNYMDVIFHRWEIWERLSGWFLLQIPITEMATAMSRSLSIEGIFLPYHSWKDLFQVRELYKNNNVKNLYKLQALRPAVLAAIQKYCMNCTFINYSLYILMHRLHYCKILSKSIQ